MKEVVKDRDAEIERLRRSQEALKLSLAVQVEHTQKLEGEIERLTASLQLAQRWAGEAADALQPSAEQNERLKAALQYARNLTGPDEIIDAVLAPPNKALKLSLAVQVEYTQRLEAALTDLLAHDYAEECQECGIGRSSAWKRARAALEGKP